MIEWMNGWMHEWMNEWIWVYTNYYMMCVRVCVCVWVFCVFCVCVFVCARKWYTYIITKILLDLQHLLLIVVPWLKCYPTCHVSMFPDRRQGLWLWPWLFQGSLPAVSRCQGDLDRKQLVPMRWKLLISHWLHLDGFAYWWLCNWKQRWWSSTFRVSFIYFQNRILKSFRDAWRVPDEPLLEKNWAMCLLPSLLSNTPWLKPLSFYMVFFHVYGPYMWGLWKIWNVAG